jgi:C4-dicarboxylate-specific signal transduction histidine kinase
LKDTDHPYAFAVALVLLAFAIRYALDPILLGRSPLLLFTVSVVVAAGRYGTGPGMVATGLSLLLATLAFIAPGLPPGLSPEHLASIGVFIVTSAAMLSFAAHLNATRARERQLVEAMQQQRTETAMGVIAATLAHELNQPLAAAANYIGAGKHLAAGLKGKGQAKLIGGLNEAEAQIHRVGEVIRHARDLVSSACQVRERVSLKAMVGNALKPLQAGGACPALRLRTDIKPTADNVSVNRIQIEQVLINLIRNACQAMPEESMDLLIAGKSGDDFTLVEVRDFGSGIPSDRLESLFSPGAKPSNGGLGLGLPISRTIIESHGGRIWAENQPDGGASFFFTLPAPRVPASSDQLSS